jgi:hypothetical protein
MDGDGQRFGHVQKKRSPHTFRTSLALTDSQAAGLREDTLQTDIIRSQT